MFGQLLFTLGYSLAIWSNSLAWTSLFSTGTSWKIGQQLFGQCSFPWLRLSLHSSSFWPVITDKQTLWENMQFGECSYSLTFIFDQGSVTKFTFITILYQWSFFPSQATKALLSPPSAESLTALWLKEQASGATIQCSKSIRIINQRINSFKPEKHLMFLESKLTIKDWLSF